jgi:hypothetical protein
MINKEILEELIHCCDFLSAVNTSELDILTIVKVKETADTAIRLIGEFDISSDRQHLLPVMRVAVINLYKASKSISSLCLAGPAEEEPPPVPVNDIYDSISLFVAVALD